MMDIVNVRYPSATLWFLGTGLSRTQPRWISSNEKEYRRSFTYIIEGMLQRAKNLKSGVKIVSGGEITVGYCHESIEELRTTTQERNKEYAKVLQTHPNLYLGGTIAPWLNKEAKRGWMAKGKCGKSKIENLAEFTPLITYLLSTYKYVWVYGAWAGGYEPFKDPHEEIRVEY